MDPRTNPFEEIERFFDQMSRQFENASSGYAMEPFGRGQSTGAMAIDLVDRDGEFVATVDLPGFERDDVTIRVTDRTLRIDAERAESIEEGDEQYVRSERSQQSTQRSIQLPEAVDAESVSAEMQNGVVTITLPKREPDSAHQIDIE